MNVSRARACVAEGSVRTCLALSAVCARLASGAPRVKKTWMNVPRSHRPADLAAVTTQWAPSTVPALLASAPEGLGRPAKVRGPGLKSLRPPLFAVGTGERQVWGGAWGQQRGRGMRFSGGRQRQRPGENDGVGRVWLQSLSPFLQI